MKKTHQFIAGVAFLLAILVQVTAFAQASSGAKPELILWRHNSTPSGPAPVIMGDTIGDIWFRAMTPNKKHVNGANIRSFVTGPVTAGVLPANLVFRTGANGVKDRMVITSTGLVGIGTMSPTFNLHTVGNTHTTGDFYGRIHFDANAGSQGPNTYIEEAYFEQKTSSELGAPDMNPGGKGGLFSLAPSPNASDAKDHQLFFNGDGIYTRRDGANAPAWASAWHKLLTGEDIMGTTNRIAKFTAPNKLGDSQLWDDGTRVGIGTTAPSEFFHVMGNSLLQGNTSITNEAYVGGNAILGANISVGGNSYVGGTTNLVGNTALSSELYVGGNSTLAGNLAVQGTGYIGQTLTVAAGIVGQNGAIITGNTSLSGGKVAIGTTVGAMTPGSHALYVNGSMVATEVKVALHGNWPDYVFEPTYQLPNLSETEAFIKANKHLPGVPSVKEVKENGGIELGEMNRILLQKVEELTLLLIEQQKQIDALRK